MISEITHDGRRNACDDKVACDGQVHHRDRDVEIASDRDNGGKVDVAVERREHGPKRGQPADPSFLSLREDGEWPGWRSKCGFQVDNRRLVGL